MFIIGFLIGLIIGALSVVAFVHYYLDKNSISIKLNIEEQDENRKTYSRKNYL